MTANRETDSALNGTEPRSAKKRPPMPAAVARRACAELAELLGREPEGVIALRRTDDGWCVGIEVVELRRIPNTADVIGEYEVDADRRGRLVSYHRVRRYPRGRAEDDS